jgi:hypothetical protein
MYRADAGLGERLIFAYADILGRVSGSGDGDPRMLQPYHVRYQAPEGALCGIRKLRAPLSKRYGCTSPHVLTRMRTCRKCGTGKEHERDTRQFHDAHPSDMRTI